MHARALLARALEAHGGADAIRALEGASATWELTEIWSYQSRRPDPPWDRSQGRRALALDLRAPRYAEHADVMAAGFYPFHDQRVLDPSGGWRANLYDGYEHALPAGELEAASADFVRFTAPLLLRAMDRGGRIEAGAGWLEAEVCGETTRAELDPATGHVTDVAWRTPDGEALRARFGAYAETRGLRAARSITLELEGERVSEIAVAELAFGAPPEARFERLERLPRSNHEPPGNAYDFAIAEIAPGVFRVGGSVWYSLLVEVEDAGGPWLAMLGTVRGAAERIAAVRERWPEREIRFALVTHHHGDHLEGIAAAARAGATLLASPGHVEAVRRAADGVPARIRPVVGELRLGRGESVRILQAGPMAHSEEMLVAFLPAAGLLFAADLYVQHPGRPLRAANPPIRDLARFVEASGLPVERLADPHTPRITTRAELLASAAREPTHPGRFAR